MAEYGVGNNNRLFFVNDHNQYPKSLGAFVKVKSVYLKRFRIVNRYTDTGISDSKFIEIITLKIITGFSLMVIVA